jgi:hypothetical protein
MRKIKAVGSWVVYQIILGKAFGVNAVCEQGEWDALKRDQPGQQKLVKRGIMTEAEADRLARGTSGDTLRSGYVKKGLRADQYRRRLRSLFMPGV